MAVSAGDPGILFKYDIEAFLSVSVERPDVKIGGSLIPVGNFLFMALMPSQYSLYNLSRCSFFHVASSSWEAGGRCLMTKGLMVLYVLITCQLSMSRESTASLIDRWRNFDIALMRCRLLRSSMGSMRTNASARPVSFFGIFIARMYDAHCRSSSEAASRTFLVIGWTYRR